MAEVSTIARPYAKAAFEHADETGELAKWSDSLARANLVATNEQVQALLESASVSDDDKAAVFIDTCGADTDQTLKNFFQLLASNKRLAALPAITEAFERLKAAREAALDVEVISAFELTAEQQQTLAGKLKQKWQKDISLSTQVDSSLIGGVVIRAGDLVIDSSLRGKLARVVEAVNS